MYWVQYLIHCGVFSAGSSLVFTPLFQPGFNSVSVWSITGQWRTSWALVPNDYPTRRDAGRGRIQIPLGWNRKQALNNISWIFQWTLPILTLLYCNINGNYGPETNMWRRLLIQIYPERCLDIYIFKEGAYLRLFSFVNHFACIPLSTHIMFRDG